MANALFVRSFSSFFFDVAYVYYVSLLVFCFSMYFDFGFFCVLDNLVRVAFSWWLVCGGFFGAMQVFNLPKDKTYYVYKFICFGTCSVCTECGNSF